MYILVKRWFMEKILNESFWKKIPNDFKLVEEDQYKNIKTLQGESKPERVYTYENEFVVFNSFEEGMEMVEIYDRQLKFIDDKNLGKDWKQSSPIKPVFHKWVEIKGKKVYFSIFEAYTSNNKLSLQLFVEKEVLIGITTSIKKDKELSFEKILNDNLLIKKLIKAII